MDEKQLLHVLPKYVSDGPDSMPSLRLYEGDLKVLMSMLEKMSNQLSSIASIVNDLHNLQPKLKSTTAPGQPVINMPQCPTAECFSVDNTDRAKTTWAGMIQSAAGRKKTSVNRSADWAARSSTPITRSQSAIRTSSTTDDDDDQGDDHFVEQHSRKFKRIKRKSSAEHSPDVNLQSAIPRKRDR